MHKILLYIIILFIGYCNCSAQDDINYPQMMRQAIKNNNLNLALRIYLDAKEEDYYNIETLQRMACEVFYLQNDYQQAFENCKSLYEQDESNNIVNLIYMCLLTKNNIVKNNNVENSTSLIAEITKQTIEYTFEKDILINMQILSQKDMLLVTQEINKYIAYQKDNENSSDIVQKEDLKDYKTMLTILYFCCNKYLDAYNSSIDYLSEDNQAVFYYILGILREKRQEYSSAHIFLTTAIKNGYNHYDAYLQRAICKGYEKDYISANKDLDTCIMIDSNYYAFYLKGVNYSLMYQYQDAMTCFDYSITLNDTFAEAYNYRGIVSTNIKEYQFAILDFKQALSLDKTTKFAHNNLGIAYEKVGKMQQAIEEYKLSIKYEPYFEGGWYNLGRIYTDFGLTKKAIRHLNKAKDIAPEISDIYYLLGLNYRKKKDKEKACDFFNKALELNHTEAQNIIDNYCNKEENTEEENTAQDNETQISFEEDEYYENEN